MTRPRGFFIFVLASLLTLASCSKPGPPAASPETKTEEAAKPSGPPATGTYKVLMATSKGDITVEVHRDWAPIGAQRFYELVQDHFYDNARFFRYVPNFVVQFGLAADPAETKKWDKQIDDDPVTHINRSGSLSFATAGPNTRTSQVFINLRTNQSLDEQGFAPFAQITDGMAVVEKLYSGYGDADVQEQIRQRGNAFLLKSYPKMDYIRTARIM